MSDVSFHAPVLVVGGGIVGLSAALFLQAHGVPFILVEQNADLSPLPRARGFSARTLELFRSIGLQDEIEAAAAAAWKQGGFGGARRGRSLLDAEPLDHARSAMLRAKSDPSPCQLTACPQTLVEPVLRRALVQRGGDARYGWALLDFVDTGTAVTARVRDPSGQVHELEASWLLAADGARSGIRHALGIPRHGPDAERHYLNIFFTADLAETVAGRTFSQCDVANDQVSGVFLAMDNATRWSFHLAFDPAKVQPEAWSDADIEARVQAAIGCDLPIALHFRAPWNTRVKVAERYAEGRAFLLGDAAHVMPPWGGFNANTGIADAHNLAWRLAWVRAGRASPGLLDAYENERRPVAIRNGEQARLRTDFDARFQIPTPANTEAMRHIVDYGALHMRYRYGSDDTVDELHAQPGTRFPHAWIIRNGTRCSTLDLFGRDFVAVGGPMATGATWRAGVDFRFEEPGVTWGTLTRRADDEVVIVRPDGFVATLSE